MTIPAPETEPYSLQWFLDIENQRHSRHARWIPKLLEFAKHSGETLLGLGHGLGTDWAQYARHGASVVVCSGSTAQLDLVRRNFLVRGLGGRFVHAMPTRLPLESCSVDVACLSSLHHGIDHPEAVVEEVYRVLKPGGKVLAVTPARYDVDFWDALLLLLVALAGAAEAPPGDQSRPSLQRPRPVPAVRPLHGTPRAQASATAVGNAALVAVDAAGGDGAADGAGPDSEGVQAD